MRGAKAPAIDARRVYVDFINLAVVMRSAGED